MKLKTEWKCLKKQLFVDNNFSIKPISESDIESIRIWRNEQKDVLRQSNHISKANQINYFNKNIWPTMKLPKPKNILMSFFNNDSLIGYGGLVNIDWDNKKAEISFLLDTKLTKSIKKYKNLHTSFLTLITKLAFKDIKLNKIYTETWDIRKEHIKNLEEFGFCLDGVLREHIFINKKKHNAMIHSILKNNHRI